MVLMQKSTMIQKIDMRLSGTLVYDQIEIAFQINIDNDLINAVETACHLTVLFFLLECLVSSVAQSCLTFCMDHRDTRLPCTITNSQSIPKLMYIASVMLSNHLMPCRPLLFPPSIFPSIRIFSNESVLCIRWPEYQSFSFSISPSSEYSGLISFKIDWLDLLAIQGTLNSLLQHHSSKASILWHSSFFNSPTLTSIHDHWKNHSLDQTYLCWQSNVSAI